MLLEPNLDYGHVPSFVPYASVLYEVSEGLLQVGYQFTDRMVSVPQAMFLAWRSLGALGDAELRRVVTVATQTGVFVYMPPELYESASATAEILDIPGFMDEFRQSVADVEEGHTFSSEEVDEYLGL
jgi:PHD/YefM family antitoxin component YafN of YafNO toxin-antitoxin module